MEIKRRPWADRILVCEGLRATDNVSTVHCPWDTEGNLVSKYCTNWAFPWGFDISNFAKISKSKEKFKKKIRIKHTLWLALTYAENCVTLCDPIQKLHLFKVVKVLYVLLPIFECVLRRLVDSLTLCIYVSVFLYVYSPLWYRLFFQRTWSMWTHTDFV